MAVVSAFCKKGGVGKTTFIGFISHYYAIQGKKVLVISVDDQNSIFKIFGKEDKIFEENDNYLEFLLSGMAEMGDVLIEVRPNLHIIKTLNADKLSMKLTLERTQEKAIKKMIHDYESYFDYIFIDFPPSSSRLTEVLLEMSDAILIVVGLDSLGLNGFFNTIQYFVDNDIDLNNIKYIVPNGFSLNRRAPKISLDRLVEQAVEFTPHAKVLPALKDRSIIKNLQSDGVSVYDDEKDSPRKMTAWDVSNRDLLREDLKEIFDELEV